MLMICSKYKTCKNKDKGDYPQCSPHEELRDCFSTSKMCGTSCAPYSRVNDDIESIKIIINGCCYRCAFSSSVYEGRCIPKPNLSICSGRDNDGRLCKDLVMDEDININLTRVDSPMTYRDINIQFPEDDDLSDEEWEEDYDNIEDDGIWRA